MLRSVLLQRKTLSSQFALHLSLGLARDHILSLVWLSSFPATSDLPTHILSRFFLV